MAKESKAWTRRDCVFSKIVHGPVFDFLTSTCPCAPAPGYSHWPVAAKSRPEWGTSASSSVSCATTDVELVVSGCRCAATAYDATRLSASVRPGVAAVATPGSTMPAVSTTTTPSTAGDRTTGAGAVPLGVASPVRPDRLAARLWSVRVPDAPHVRSIGGRRQTGQLSSQFANMLARGPRIRRHVERASARRRWELVRPRLRRAWLGYQLRLDQAMAEAGFGERGFPDGRARLANVRGRSWIDYLGHRTRARHHQTGRQQGRGRTA